jgi:hypothetical protein
VSGGGGGGRGTPGSVAEFVEDLERRVAAGELSQAEVEAARGMLRIVTDKGARHNWVTAATGGR